MQDRKGAFTLILGEPWNGKLEDFCEAFFKGQKTEVIRRALDFYIPARLATAPAERAIYDQLQAKRDETTRGAIRLVTRTEETSGGKEVG